MRKRIEITAARDRDIIDILKKFELSEKMGNGELSCESCSQNLTWENLGAMVVKEGGLLLFCDLSECINEASRREK